MKPFSLIRKYLLWAKGVNPNSNQGIHLRTFFWWPWIFCVLGTLFVRWFLYPESSGNSLCLYGFLGLVGGLSFLWFSSSISQKFGKGMDSDICSFLSNGIPIILIDVAILPFLGFRWFFWKLCEHAGLMITFAKQKLRFVSIENFTNGKFRKDRIQPCLLRKAECTWNRQMVLEILQQVVRDQIGRSLREEETENRLYCETVCIECLSLDEESKTAQVCFSITVCFRDGADGGVKAGYYFVSLAFDSELNVVDVSKLLFDSNRGQKDAKGRQRSFELYVATVSDDLGAGYDPLRIEERERLLQQPGFSPEPPQSQQCGDVVE